VPLATPNFSCSHLGCQYSNGRPEFQTSCVSAPRIDAIGVKSPCAHRLLAPTPLALVSHAGVTSARPRQEHQSRTEHPGVCYTDGKGYGGCVNLAREICTVTYYKELYSKKFSKEPDGSNYLSWVQKRKVRKN
jgi:hypothetical protein